MGPEERNWQVCRYFENVLHMDVAFLSCWLALYIRFWVRDRVGVSTQWGFVGTTIWLHNFRPVNSLDGSASCGRGSQFTGFGGGWGIWIKFAAVPGPKHARHASSSGAGGET